MKILSTSIKKTYALLILILIVLATYLYLNFVSHNPLNINSKIDSIKVDKSERKLCVYSKGRLNKVYKISLGKNPDGAKQYQ
jgi:hypothetical protein